MHWPGIEIKSLQDTGIPRRTSKEEKSLSLSTHREKKAYSRRGPIRSSFLLRLLGPVHVAISVPEYRARICKPFMEPGNRLLAWRAGTTTLFDVPDRQAT
jgi:hypothetical protein